VLINGFRAKCSFRPRPKSIFKWKVKLLVGSSSSGSGAVSCLIVPAAQLPGLLVASPQIFEDSVECFRGDLKGIQSVLLVGVSESSLAGSPLPKVSISNTQSPPLLVGDTKLGSILVGADSVVGLSNLCVGVD